MDSRGFLFVLLLALFGPLTLAQTPVSSGPTAIQESRAGQTLPMIPPNAQRVAKEIGVWSLVERCRTLASERKETGNIPLEELALHQQITEAVVSASLDVEGVLAEIDDERAQILERQALLASKRDRKVYLLSLANIAVGTGTGIIGTAMQFDDRTAIAGDAVGVAGGGAGVFLSILGLRQQGGKISLGVAPNMLAPIFGRKAELRSIYPQDVWTYLTTAPTSDFRVQSSWQEELIREWMRLGRIGPLEAPKSQKKIDLLTSRIAEHQKLSVDVLQDRSLMLLDLRTRVSLMSRDLRDLMKAVTLASAP